ncbi:MAG: N-methyl-L-tryptophan oxidase [Mesorhizobium sp.]
MTGRNGAVYAAAVVGLGAMGSAALFHLTRRGLGTGDRRVIGLEQFEPGHDRGSSHGESRAIRLGYSEHPSYVPLLRRAFRNWRALEKLSETAFLTTTGILEAGKPGSRMVAGSLEACLLHHLPHERLDAAEVNRRFPAFALPDGYSAVWQSEGGFLQPEVADQAHRALAAAAGAEIATRARVLAIEPERDAVILRLADRQIAARRLVIAAGPWSADLLPQLRPVLALKRQVLCWYRPRNPAKFALGALPVFMVDGEDDILYGFPDFRGSGFKCASHLGSRVLAQADDARQDAGPEDERRTRRFLQTYLPEAAGPLLAMKTCIYTMTPDENFILDLLPEDPRIVVASPCSGHGYKFASVIGEVAADLALDGATAHDIGRFSIARFAGGTD